MAIDAPSPKLSCAQYITLCRQRPCPPPNPNSNIEQPAHAATRRRQHGLDNNNHLSRRTLARRKQHTNKKHVVAWSSRENICASACESYHTLTHTTHYHGRMAHGRRLWESERESAHATRNHVCNTAGCKSGGVL